jgi:hypothetical protein
LEEKALITKKMIRGPQEHPQHDTEQNDIKGKIWSKG